MITKLDDAFRFHEVALSLRAQRQELIASNIANADTPGFKARDIDFAPALEGALAGRSAAPAGQLRTTAARHLEGQAPGGIAATPQYRMPVQASIDGNTVEMDGERARFAENALHYETNLTVIGMEIKKLLSALQG